MSNIGMPQDHDASDSSSRKELLMEAAVALAREQEAARLASTPEVITKEKQAIKEARERYFENHPFDPHQNALLGHGEDGLPAGFLTLPDMGEMQVVSIKFGYEFLAAVRTDDDVDEWLSNIAKTAQGTDLMGIMLAHAFRSIAPMLNEIINSNPLRAANMRKVSASGWETEF